MTHVKHLLDAKQSAGVATVSPGLTVLKASMLMNEKRIGSLVVVDEGQVVGIFTERDVLRRVVAVQLDPSYVTVAEVMTQPILACQLETPLDECRRLMTNRRIRHLPAIEQGTLVGIVTIGDLLACQINDQQNVIEHLNEYLHGDSAPVGA